MMFARNLTYLIVVGCVTLNSEAFSQSYDQLKVQLQFENFYGSKARNSKVNSEISGSYCLNDDWLPVEINLTAGTVNFDQAKLNLINSTIEVMYKEREMFIAPEHFNTMKLMGQERWFLPGPKYIFEGIALKGFLEVFEPAPKGPFIAQNHYVYVKEPSSNGYVSGGSTEKKFVKSSSIYLINGQEVVAIKNRKSLERVYANQKELFAKYVKSLDTDFKNARSVHILVSTLNEQIPK